MFAGKIMTKQAFYDLPISSDHFDIFMSDGNLSAGVIKVDINNVKSKMFAMPLNNDTVFAPLRHSNLPP